MEAKPTAEMALKHKGVDRGDQDGPLRGARVDAGRAGGRGGDDRRHPGDGRFRREPARAAARRAASRRSCGRATSTRTSIPACGASSTPDGPRQPGPVRGPQARRPLRRRPRRRQLHLARRRADHQGRLPARHDLDRPPHRQHERGHEGHAERHEQVPGPGPAARRGDRALDLEPGARDPAGGAGQPLGGGAGGRGRAAARERATSASSTRSAARLQGAPEARLRDDAARRQDRLRSRTASRAPTGPRCRRTTAAPATRAGTPRRR